MVKHWGLGRKTCIQGPTFDSSEVFFVSASSSCFLPLLVVPELTGSRGCLENASLRAGGRGSNPRACLASLVLRVPARK